MAPDRRQAIISTTVDRVQRRINVVLAWDELLFEPMMTLLTDALLIYATRSQ